MIIRPSDFSEVKPIWEKHLWDSRYQFEPTSAMLFLGGYDGAIATKFKPCFFAAEINGKLAGVINGHATSLTDYRLRGLFIFEEFRGKHVGAELIETVIAEAKIFGSHFFWAAPRASNMALFEKLGFRAFSEPTNEGFLYGPNCYMGLKLKD